MQLEMCYTLDELMNPLKASNLNRLMRNKRNQV